MAHAVKNMVDYLDEVGKELFKKPEVANKVRQLCGGLPFGSPDHGPQRHHKTD